MDQRPCRQIRLRDSLVGFALPPASRTNETVRPCLPPDRYSHTRRHRCHSHPVRPAMLLRQNRPVAPDRPLGRMRHERRYAEPAAAAFFKAGFSASYLEPVMDFGWGCAAADTGLRLSPVMRLFASQRNLHPKSITGSRDHAMRRSTYWALGAGPEHRIAKTLFLGLPGLPARICALYSRDCDGPS